MMNLQKISAAVLLSLFALVSAGCRSKHVEVTVENRTGVPIRLLEVDYPNASFGADALADGAAMHYRIQVQGNGPVKVQYTAPDHKQPQIQGPELKLDQEGQLYINLLPNGKAEFKN